MNGRELLELAAKAAGLQIVGNVDAMFVQPGHLAGGLVFRNERGGDSLWNPLTDDGDALRLATTIKRFPSTAIDGLGVWCGYETMQAGPRRYEKPIAEKFGDDPGAAVRRAIVRAAAEIGKAQEAK